MTSSFFEEQISQIIALLLGLQKGGTFPVNFGNIPEILETFLDFFGNLNLPGIFGKFPEIYHPFATLFVIQHNVKMSVMWLSKWWMCFPVISFLLTFFFGNTHNVELFWGIWVWFVLCWFCSVETVSKALCDVFSVFMLWEGLKERTPRSLHLLASVLQWTMGESLVISFTHLYDI